MPDVWRGLQGRGCAADAGAPVWPSRVTGTAQRGGRPCEAALGGLGLMFVFQLPV